MTLGESTRRIASFEILKFLYENEGFQSFNDIEQKCSQSRNTVKKYLEELKEKGLVEQSLKGRHPYRITEKGRSHFDKELLKRDIYDLTEFFDIKWLEMLRRMLANMRVHGTDPEVFFKDNCLTFVGGIPRTFEKSVKGMRAIIEWEKGLEIRATKEGMTKEDYWRKKLKEAKKLKGVRRILTSLGFTEEEIEELRRQQGGTFKVTRLTKKER